MGIQPIDGIAGVHFVENVSGSPLNLNGNNVEIGLSSTALSNTALSNIEALLEEEYMASDMSDLYELDEEIIRDKLLGTLQLLRSHTSNAASGNGVANVISDVKQLLGQLLYLLAAYLRKALGYKTKKHKKKRFYKKKNVSPKNL